MVDHSDCVGKACHSWGNPAIVVTSTLKYQSCCPLISMTSNAVSLKPSLAPSVTRVRQRQQVQEAAVSEQQYTRIVLHNSYATSYHSEQETAEFCHLEVQIIRQLRDVGVIRGIEVAGEGQRYSDDELALLRRVRRLHYDLGINMEGVEVIMRLYAQLEALQREVERYRREKGI
jgi:hypothetical protein